MDLSTLHHEINIFEPGHIVLSEGQGIDGQNAMQNKIPVHDVFPDFSVN